MRIVVDASVAIKWVLAEADAEAADALRKDELIAPSLWLLEAASAIWRRSRRGEFDTAEALGFLSELQRAPVASLPLEPHLDQTLSLAAALGHPVYDCLYLAMAIHYQTCVVTADRRFAAIAARPELQGRVRLLGR